MKLTFRVLAFILIFPTINSCNVFEDVDNFTFRTIIDEAFDVNDGEAGSYSDQVTWSLTEDPQVVEYRNRINEITINELNYSVRRFIGPDDAVLNGQLLLGENGTLATIEVTQLNLNNSIGLTFIAPLSDGQKEAIANHLLENLEMELALTGNLSNGPVDFVIDVFLDADITAEVID